MNIPQDEVRAALERVLASQSFAGAGRLSRLLRYLVERTLSGEGDQLKEYVVGVEVFDRGATYDPRVDSIVRVEAGRLRAKLDEYYRAAGADDPVVISIPRGGYAPVFSPIQARTPLAGSTPPPNLHRAAASRRVRVGVAVGAAAALLIAIVAAWRSTNGGLESQAENAGTISIAVLPLTHFSADPDVARLAARITDGITADLARERGLSVVSRTSAAQFKSEQQPIREVAAALGADLVMEGSVVVEGGGVHVIVRLVDANVDRKVWVGEYDSQPDQIVELHRRIGAEAAAAALRRQSTR